MKAKIFVLILLLALIISGCATTQQASLPEAKEASPETEAAAKLSRTEIEVKVAQELQRLGETQLAEEERRAAAEQEKGEVTYDIPITINAQVERWIDYFQTRIPKRFQLWLSRSGRYDKMMRGILKEYGLPEDLFYLAMIESGFSCNAYSRAHAVGPWQFISGTGRRYGLQIDYWVDERRDPVKATHAAAQYLKDLYKEFGSWYLAAAAYNAGEAKIRRALKRYGAEDFWSISHHQRRYLKSETKNYVPKMIAAALIAKEPEKYGFKQVAYQEAMSFDEVSVHGGTNLGVAAKLAGVNTQDLAALNPELRRWCTPPNQTRYTLRIPAGAKASFETAYAALPKAERKARIGTVSVRVQRGDTLGRLAATYRVPLRDLLAMNPRLDPRRLQVGQVIQIPPHGANVQDSSTAVASSRSQRRAKVRSYAASDRGTRKIVHVVKRGDTLWDIAQAYGISHNDIRRWNGRNGSRLNIGQKLVLYVPQVKAEAKLQPSQSAVVYVVQRGDNLWEISRRFKTTPAAIRRWNGLSTSRITPGDRLTVRLADNNS